MTSCSMYPSQFSIQSADNHTEKSHQIEEGQSLGFFSKIADGAAGLYHSAGNAVSGAAHTAFDVASNTYHGAVNMANAGSGYIKRAEDGVTQGLHAAEDWV